MTDILAGEGLQGNFFKNTYHGNPIIKRILTSTDTYPGKGTSGDIYANRPIPFNGNLDVFTSLGGISSVVNVAGNAVPQEVANGLGSVGSDTTNYHGEIRVVTANQYNTHRKHEHNLDNMYEHNPDRFLQLSQHTHSATLYYHYPVGQGMDSITTHSEYPIMQGSTPYHFNDPASMLGIRGNNKLDAEIFASMLDNDGRINESSFRQVSRAYGWSSDSPGLQQQLLTGEGKYNIPYQGAGGGQPAIVNGGMKEGTNYSLNIGGRVDTSYVSISSISAGYTEIPVNSLLFYNGTYWQGSGSDINYCTNAFLYPRSCGCYRLSPAARQTSNSCSLNPPIILKAYKTLYNRKYNGYSKRSRLADPDDTKPAEYMPTRYYYAAALVIYERFQLSNGHYSWRPYHIIGDQPRCIEMDDLEYLTYQSGRSTFDGISAGCDDTNVKNFLWRHHTLNVTKLHCSRIGGYDVGVSLQIPMVRKLWYNYYPTETSFPLEGTRNFEDPRLTIDQIVGPAAFTVKGSENGTVHSSSLTGGGTSHPSFCNSNITSYYHNGVVEVTSSRGSIGQPVYIMYYE